MHPCSPSELLLRVAAIKSGSIQVDQASGNIVHIMLLIFLNLITKAIATFQTSAATLLNFIITLLGGMFYANIATAGLENAQSAVFRDKKAFIQLYNAYFSLFRPGLIKGCKSEWPCRVKRAEVYNEVLLEMATVMKKRIECKSNWKQVLLIGD